VPISYRHLWIRPSSPLNRLPGTQAKPFDAA
jgi:hypothetical protein